MLSRTYRTLWTGSKVHCLNVSFDIVGRPDYEGDFDFDPWAEPLINYGAAIPCPASSPPPLQLIKLATMVRHQRPELNHFFFSVQCSFHDELHRAAGAKWQLEYPANALEDRFLDNRPIYGSQDLTTKVTLALEAKDVVTLTSYGQHPESACCLSIRADELDSFGESAWKARAEAEEAEMLYSDEYPSSDRSDEGA
jgi:hypothetical protein